MGEIYDSKYMGGRKSRVQSTETEFPGTRLPKYQGLRRSEHSVTRTVFDTDDFSRREAVVSTIKKVIQEGRAHRIMVKDDYGNILHEISLTSGVLGAVLFPSIASLVGLAAMAGNRRVVVERIDAPRRR